MKIFKTNFCQQCWRLLLSDHHGCQAAECFSIKNPD